MAPTSVEIVAMGWVDLSQRQYVRWWVGEPRPQPGLRLHVQVAECEVEGVVVVLFWSHPPATPERQAAALQVLREHFGPDALIALTETFGAGWSRLSAQTPAPSPASRRRVAAAVAVIHASWAWDESSEIRVEDGDGVVIACPRREEGGWRVGVGEGI